MPRDTAVIPRQTRLHHWRRPRWAAQRRPARVAPGKRRSLLAILGPGLITGAADDDPSGIATYSQAGAQFRYSTGWVMLFTWPLMAAIQEISPPIAPVPGQATPPSRAD